MYYLAYSNIPLIRVFIYTSWAQKSQKIMVHTFLFMVRHMDGDEQESEVNSSPATNLLNAES